MNTSAGWILFISLVQHDRNPNTEIYRWIIMFSLFFFSLFFSFLGIYRRMFLDIYIYFSIISIIVCMCLRAEWFGDGWPKRDVCSAPCDDEDRSCANVYKWLIKWHGSITIAPTSKAAFEDPTRRFGVAFNSTKGKLRMDKDEEKENQEFFLPWLVS